jgi:hypothetical protein
MHFSHRTARGVIKGEAGRSEQNVAEDYFEPRIGNWERVRSSKKS